MKTTKKAIYNKYGIEYKGGKILTPIGWTCELLKVGNSKTGKAVRTWSMNQTTCCCRCVGCYADSGFYKTDTVIQSLARNTEIATKYPEFFKRALFAQLETFPDGTEIRIHAVGDFFNLEYVNTWQEAVASFQNLIFWTYTKTEYEHAFDGFENANIVPSLIDGEYNFGHCDHVMKLHKKLKKAGKKVHICRCGFDDSQHCEGCHQCSISDFVLFVEHSTDYKAKDDPLYKTLFDIVNNQ